MRPDAQTTSPHAQEKQSEPYKNVAYREMLKNISPWLPAVRRTEWSFEPIEFHGCFRSPVNPSDGATQKNISALPVAAPKGSGCAIAVSGRASDLVVEDREEVGTDYEDVVRVVFPKGDVVANLAGVVAILV